MTGAEYNPNDVQPNNPNIKDWVDSLMCPWNLNECGDEALGAHGDEWRGVPASTAPNVNAQYPVKNNPQAAAFNRIFEPKRRTMSCALCAHLRRQLGKAPLLLDPPPIDEPGHGYDEGDEHLYTANWDFHPFGAWLANEAARVAHVGRFSQMQRDVAVGEVVDLIHEWKVSNGEEMHGFLWQSTRLLAYDTGTLQGTRRERVDEHTAALHVMKVCKPTWNLAAQTRDDCSHAAGHGFFYYFLDIGRAVSACWSELIMAHTPQGYISTRQWWEQPSVTALKLMQWRWLCATGVYHAAGNTLSLELLERLTHLPRGPNVVEEFLCKFANTWGPNTRFFDRCAAGLGISEAEKRLESVRSNECFPPTSRYDEGHVLRPPAPWELRQLMQYGPIQQRSCNPAKYFVVAIGQSRAIRIEPPPCASLCALSGPSASGRRCLLELPPCACKHAPRAASAVRVYTARVRCAAPASVPPTAAPRGRGHCACVGVHWRFEQTSHALLPRPTSASARSAHPAQHTPTVSHPSTSSAPRTRFFGRPSCATSRRMCALCPMASWRPRLDTARQPATARAWETRWQRHP